jgi:hypothetical protein
MEHCRRSSLALAARVATVFYFICCSVVLPLGVVAGGVALLHMKTASTYPAGDKTVRFKRGDDVYYNTAALLKWRNRLMIAGAVGAPVLLIAGGVMLPLRVAARMQAKLRQPNGDQRPSAIARTMAETAAAPPRKRRFIAPRFRTRSLVYAVLGAATVAVLIIAYSGYVHVPRGEQIRLGISAVQKGMTEQEVDAIMGGPPDERQRGNDAYNIYERKIWRHGEREGHVMFTNGRVVLKTSR